MPRPALHIHICCRSHKLAELFYPHWSSEAKYLITKIWLNFSPLPRPLNSDPSSACSSTQPLLRISRTQGKISSNPLSNHATISIHFQQSLGRNPFYLRKLAEHSPCCNSSILFFANSFWIKFFLMKFWFLLYLPDRMKATVEDKQRQETMRSKRRVCLDCPKFKIWFLKLII